MTPGFAAASDSKRGICCCPSNGTLNMILLPVPLHRGCTSRPWTAPTANMRVSSLIHSCTCHCRCPRAKYAPCPCAWCMWTARSRQQNTLSRWGLVGTVLYCTVLCGSVMFCIGVECFVLAQGVSWRRGKVAFAACGWVWVGRILYFQAAAVFPGGTLAAKLPTHPSPVLPTHSGVP